MEMIWILLLQFQVWKRRFLETVQQDLEGIFSGCFRLKGMTKAGVKTAMFVFTSTLSAQLCCVQDLTCLPELTVTTQDTADSWQHMWQNPVVKIHPMPALPTVRQIYYWQKLHRTDEKGRTAKSIQAVFKSKHPVSAEGCSWNTPRVIWSQQEDDKRSRLRCTTIADKVESEANDLDETCEISAKRRLWPAQYRLKTQAQPHITSLAPKISINTSKSCLSENVEFF